MSDTLDTPDRFEEWPRETQVAFVNAELKKHDIVTAIREEIGMKSESGSSPGLSKDEWCELLLALREGGDE